MLHMLFKSESEEDILETENVHPNRLEQNISMQHVSTENLRNNPHETSMQVFRWFKAKAGVVPENNILTAEVKLREMLEALDRWRMFVSPTILENILVDTISIFCFQNYIVDRELMTAVFNAMFISWKNFAPLFYKAIIQPTDIMLWETDPPSGSTSTFPSCSFLSYILRQTSNTGLTYNNIRIIDISISNFYQKPPVFVASSCWRLEAVEKLLRYGAEVEGFLINPEDNEFRVSDSLVESLRYRIQDLWHYVDRESAAAIEITTDQQSSSTGPESEIRFPSSQSVNNLIGLINVLLRSVAHVPHGSLDFEFHIYKGGNDTLLVDAAYFVRQLASSGYLPSLQRRYLEPPELKHICRCQIRKSLNMNWQLPQGIEKLLVSNLLKKYLDLKLD